jgi:hypothetical protein
MLTMVAMPMMIKAMNIICEKNIKTLIVKVTTTMMVKVTTTMMVKVMRTLYGNYGGCCHRDDDGDGDYS